MTTSCYITSETLTRVQELLWEYDNNEESVRFKSSSGVQGELPQLSNLDFFTFKGTNPRECLKKCHEFLALHQIFEEPKVAFVEPYGESRAGTWAEFKVAPLNRFERRPKKLEPQEFGALVLSTPTSDKLVAGLEEPQESEEFTVTNDDDCGLDRSAPIFVQANIELQSGTPMVALKLDETETIESGGCPGEEDSVAQNQESPSTQQVFVKTLERDPHFLLDSAVIINGAAALQDNVEPILDDGNIQSEFGADAEPHKVFDYVSKRTMNALSAPADLLTVLEVPRAWVALITSFEEGTDFILISQKLARLSAKKIMLNSINFCSGKAGNDFKDFSTLEMDSLTLSLGSYNVDSFDSLSWSGGNELLKGVMAVDCASSTRQKENWLWTILGHSSSFNSQRDAFSVVEPSDKGVKIDCYQLRKSWWVSNLFFIEFMQLKNLMTFGILQSGYNAFRVLAQTGVLYFDSAYHDDLEFFILKGAKVLRTDSIDIVNGNFTRQAAFGCHGCRILGLLMIGLG